MGFIEINVGLESVAKAVPRRNVRLLVDTGAIYSIVPRKVLGELGIDPTDRLTFDLANGSTIERDIGEARFFADSRRGVSPVIFGEEGDAGVLGVVTLEALGLELDPVRRQVRPARLMLY